jgi:phospholipid-translocating ATPase
MSIAGVSYGQDEKDCEDAYKKDVTNFNMVDSDLNKLIKSISSGSNDMYESTQRFLYHLALCHTVITVPKDDNLQSNQFCSPSPDELALINAAKYYGIKFIERN